MHEVDNKSPTAELVLALGSSDPVPGPHPLPRGKTHTAAGVTQQGDVTSMDASLPCSLVTRRILEQSHIRAQHHHAMQAMQPLLGCPLGRDPPGSTAWAGKWHLGSLLLDPGVWSSAVTQRDLGWRLATVLTANA